MEVNYKRKKRIILLEHILKNKRYIYVYFLISFVFFFNFRNFANQIVPQQPQLVLKMQPALRRKLKFPAANADFFLLFLFFFLFLYNLYNVLYYFVHYIIYISGYIYRRPHCHVFTCKNSTRRAPVPTITHLSYLIILQPAVQKK